jgi:hypothetical protein
MKRTILLGIIAVVCLTVPPSLSAQESGGLEARGFEGQELGLSVASRAQNYLQVDYRYGGSDAGGMDCSGLVYRVFLEAAGLRLPRSVANLYEQGTEVTGTLLPGDLLFFNTDGREPSHVGIHIGGGQMIHAASQGPETGVIVSSLNETYYRSRYLQGRRIIPTSHPEIAVDLPAAGVTLKLEQNVPSGYPVKLLLRKQGAVEEFLTVRFEREGQPWLSRLVRLKSPFVELWFTPPAGNWRIVCENRQRQVVADIEFKSGRIP